MKVFILLAFVISTISAAALDLLIPESRITNGEPAIKGEAPFIVSLVDGSFHFCAGSIIDKHWVLTAAHCLTYRNFKVIAGLYRKYNHADVQIRKVSRWGSQFAHQKYKGANDFGPYDIGLIYIDKPFDLNALSRDGSAPVAKINLPSGFYEQIKKCKLYGWGRLNTGATPLTLQKLDVNIIDYTECKAALPYDGKDLDPLHICTHNPGTSDGACDGDSGGPLVRYTPDRAELVGIVSWGVPFCSRNKYASVYTNTSVHSEWILNTISNFNTVDKTPLNIKDKI